VVKFLLWCILLVLWLAFGPDRAGTLPRGLAAAATVPPGGDCGRGVLSLVWALVTLPARVLRL